MLTAKQNRRLTQVGAGTPMGELLRRYWQPIAAAADLYDKKVIPVRIMGEDLILYRDLQDRMGLVSNRCAHRLVDLKFGYVTEEGLRCPYHAWTYDGTGQCVAQPAEPEGSNFKNKIKIKAYPVHEMDGLIFAYMGPLPVPLLPRWDRVRPSAKVKSFKLVHTRVVPCNWLQIAENGLDYSHSQWLHGAYYLHHLKETGVPESDPQWKSVRARAERKQVKLGFDRCEYGLISRVLLDGQSEDSESWRIGHLRVFPNTSCLAQSGSSMQNYAVPIDDEHTLHIWLEHYYFDPDLDVKKQEVIPHYELPWDRLDEHGNFLNNNVNDQDYMVFVAQDTILDRSQERLGQADVGIIKYVQMLQEQMKVVEDGGEPMNVFHDPAELARLETELPPPLDWWYDRGRSGSGPYRRGSTTATRQVAMSEWADTIEDLFEAESKLKAAKATAA